MSEQPSIVIACGHGLYVGGQVSLQRLPVTRWERFCAWLRRVLRMTPKREHYTITQVDQDVFTLNRPIPPVEIDNSGFEVTR